MLTTVTAQGQCRVSLSPKMAIDRRQQREGLGAHLDAVWLPPLGHSAEATEVSVSPRMTPETGEWQVSVVWLSEPSEGPECFKPVFPPLPPHPFSNLQAAPNYGHNG